MDFLYTIQIYYIQFLKKLYNFRNNNMLQRKNDKTIYFCTEYILSLAP